ncbi:MAG: ATP-dependent helicase [Gammaproteobacteria bacterium]|nr:ATP-dependent helicase [Gammaproteobacteria bacterium]MBU1725095.1 ATP-dependent helicase [Gammaproteobacteria bacterium]MBU2007183.1 ATP-dependent helicase [Gammaproteobacteria bacterium]
MKLTDEQRRAIHHDGHTVITACPGSGKTRTIIAKILRCINELVGTPRKIGCITYTNTAVHEIESRIRSNGVNDESCHEVSTIHAFCQANILSKYYWATEDYKDGYIILSSDHDDYAKVVDEVGRDYKLDSYARSQFESLNRSPDGSPLSSSIPEEAVNVFWRKLAEEGYIDFCNIIYHSYRILKDNPSIAHNLSCRFAYLLVDEFQDTSTLQVELLKLIHAQGHTKFFLVGDPEQSIYSFAGARRELMMDFAETIGAQKFPVLGNFRTTRPLVDSAERLIPRQPPMLSASSKSLLNPSISYIHTGSSFAAVTDYFIPFLNANNIDYGNAAILAPNWFVLLPLGKQLREYGIPVVGPGARPYKRKYLLGRIAEQVCAYLESASPEILRQLEKELFAIASELTGKPVFQIFSYVGMKTVQRILREGQRLCQLHEGAKDWLNEVALVFENILIEDRIIPSSFFGCLRDSKDEMFDEMRKHHIDIENMALADLGMLADPRKNMKLMTMHTAKGREFEAVAIICAHDGLIPYHNYYNHLTDDALSESRRLFYVAMTRAERGLFIFSSNNNKNLPPSRFIAELDLE